MLTADGKKAGKDLRPLASKGNEHDGVRIGRVNLGVGQDGKPPENLPPDKFIAGKDGIDGNIQSVQAIKNGIRPISHAIKDDGTRLLFQVLPKGFMFS
jgi:hypothetical protein